MRFGFASTLSSALALLAMATPAQAEWRVAETEHFVYYSEASPDDLRETINQLETFDKLVRALTGNTRPPSKVKVVMFEVPNMEAVNETFPYPSQGVGGYYSSTEQGPFLVTFRNTLRPGRGSANKAAARSIAWGPQVRQHEYLHHYMYQYFNANYPTWYSEGFAEYYGTMTFEDGGIVEVGHPPFFRLDAMSAGWLDVEKLLTAKSYADVGGEVGLLYAEGWLLTHLAATRPERGKQLAAYLNAVASGTSYEEAARVFGDLDVLNRELKKYRNEINAVRLSLKPQDSSAIAVRELSTLESQLMRYQIRLYSGIEYADLPQIIAAVKKMRTPEPDNLMGLRVQAQLENLAGEHAGAAQTAKRLLALQPDDIIGHTHLGIAEAGQLTAASDETAWDAAREHLKSAIALSPIATEPRVALFQSFLDQGTLPSLDAQNRLVEAFTLLPSNDDIRYLLARDFEQRNLIDDAIAIIKPSAFGSFDGDDKVKRKREAEMAEAAERYSSIKAYESPADMLARLEAKRDGRWDPATQSIAAITPN